MTTAPSSPVAPRPAASVLLVRPGVACPVEVYMIRREKSMRFLGGFYAFPGGKVEPMDGSADALARCRGISSAAALAAFPAADGIPPLAFWVTAARELVEETGLLVGCDADGRPVDLRDPAVRDRVERLRHALVGEEAPFHVLLGREGWHLDLAPFRYLSHFITPPSSPIRLLRGMVKPAASMRSRMPWNLWRPSVCAAHTSSSVSKPAMYPSPQSAGSAIGISPARKRR